MTTNCIWRKMPEDNPIPAVLSQALKGRYPENLYDKDLLAQRLLWTEHSHRYWLEGLKDAGMPGANELYEALKLNGEIIIMEKA